MIDYEITSIDPKRFFLQIRYSEGGKEFYKTFNPRDFSDSSVEAYIERGSIMAQDYWAAQNAQPEANNVSVAITGQLKTISREPNLPVYDPFTQKLEEAVLSEDSETKTIGYSPVSMTAQEQTDYLVGWRTTAECRMAQARLALRQSGLLTAVETARAAMTGEEKEQFDIVWEYGATVKRNDPWVASMSVTLSLTDTQLDDLFKLAVTL